MDKAIWGAAGFLVGLLSVAIFGQPTDPATFTGWLKSWLKLR